MLRFLLLVLLTTSCCFVVTNSHADVYRWVDKNGKVHYSDKPNHKAEQLQLQPISSIATPVVELNPDAKIIQSSRQQKVVMYSTAWCGVCRKARDFMRANKIRFVEYDIEKSASAKRAYDKHKAKGVPLILVGDSKMNGFSATKLMAMLERQKKQTNQ